jgi:heat shock protein HslJ
MHKHISTFLVLVVSAVVVIVCIEFVPMPKRFLSSRADYTVVPVPADVMPVGQIPATPEVPQKEPIDLEGRTYRLVSYNSIASPGSAAYTLSFDDGRVSAKFCNGVGGEYTLKGAALSAPQLISTMMYCESPKGLMDAEQLFGRMLAEGVTVRSEGAALTLSSASGTMVFARTN